jgi:hypothetical protein
LGFIWAALGADSKDLKVLIKDVIWHLQMHGEAYVSLFFLFALYIICVLSSLILQMKTWPIAVVNASL